MFFKNTYYVFRGYRVIKTDNKTSEIVLTDSFYTRTIKPEDIKEIVASTQPDAIFYRNVFHLLKALKSLTLCTPNIIGAFYIDDTGKFNLISLIACSENEIKKVKLKDGMPEDLLYVSDILNLITYIKENMNMKGSEKNDRN